MQALSFYKTFRRTNKVFKLWYYRHFYIKIFYWTTSTNMVKFVRLVLTNILYLVSEMHLSKYFFVEIVVPNTFVKWRSWNVSSKSGLFKLLNSCFIYETFMWRLIYLNQHLKSAFTSISWSRKKIFRMQIVCSLWYIILVQICIYYI